MNHNEYVKAMLTAISVILVAILSFLIILIAVFSYKDTMSEDSQAELIEVCLKNDYKLAMDLSGNGNHYCIMGE